jgi:hypothetical protein
MGRERLAGRSDGHECGVSRLRFGVEGEGAGRLKAAAALAGGGGENLRRKFPPNVRAAHPPTCGRIRGARPRPGARSTLQFTPAARAEPLVPLDTQVARTPNGLELGQAEVAELLLQSIHEAEEQVVAVELRGVPGPPRPGSEELHPEQRVGFVLRGVEFWELGSDFLGQ